MSKQFKSKSKSKIKNEETEVLRAQLARALADYDNLRKRTEAEKAGWEKIAASKAVSKLLPTLDMLESAQKHLKDSGLEVVLRQFRQTSSEMGLEEISVKEGDEFDPLLEEAVEIVEGGTPHKIAGIVQKGWKIRGEAFIIRPAKVKVYGEISEKKKELEKEATRGDYM